MIITGGKYRGRKISTGRGLDFRPTSGKTRQALFNILSGEIANASFIDLFAGSGSVGLEAVSRGAGRVCMVEKNAPVFKILRSNCRSLDINNIDLKKKDVFTCCRELEDARITYDIVFADPPFAESFDGILKFIAPIVSTKGTGVVQFPVKTPPCWLKEANKVRKYGESGLAFFYY